jgi:probable rRNA maturation factor
MLVEIANQTKTTINRSLIERAVKTVLRFGKVDGLVSVVIVSDAKMKQLNYQFRRKNKITDVLSFREQDGPLPEKGFIGELIIDYSQIKRQAKKFKHSVAYELAFIVIHGTLHLLGYEDETARGVLEMDKLGNKLINKNIL